MGKVHFAIIDSLRTMRIAYKSFGGTHPEFEKQTKGRGVPKYSKNQTKVYNT